MEKMLKKKRIYQVDPCPETPEKWKEKQAKEFEIYGKFFKNREEFEYFVMLPLSDEQRVELLLVMKKERDFNQKLENCRGEMQSEEYNTEHRKYCLECCTSHRPSIAKPFYQ